MYFQNQVFIDCVQSNEEHMQTQYQQTNRGPEANSLLFNGMAKIKDTVWMPNYFLAADLSKQKVGQSQYDLILPTHGWVLTDWKPKSALSCDGYDFGCLVCDICSFMEGKHPTREEGNACQLTRLEDSHQ